MSEGNQKIPENGDSFFVLVKKRIKRWWANPEIAREKLGLIADAFSLITKGALAIGGSLLFINCLTGRFVPTDLSFGDTALLLFVFFTMVWLQLFTVGIGAFSTMWIVKAYCRVRNRSGSKSGKNFKYENDLSSGHVMTAISVLMLLLIFLSVGISVYLHPNVTNGYLISLLLLNMAVGFFINMSLVTTRSDAQIDSVSDQLDSVLRVKRVFFSIVILTCMPLVLFPAKFADIILRIDGIRIEDGIVVLSDENFKKLNYAAGIMGGDIVSCNPSSEGLHAVANIDIRWHGVGKTTYVMLKQGQNNNESWWSRLTSMQPSMEIPLNSEGVWPIKTSGEKWSRKRLCDDSQPNVSSQISAATVNATQNSHAVQQGNSKESKQQVNH